MDVRDRGGGEGAGKMWRPGFGLAGLKTGYETVPDILPGRGGNLAGLVELLPAGKLASIPVRGREARRFQDGGLGRLILRRG